MKASQRSPEQLESPGLPRPIRTDPSGTGRPVPWTQGHKDWGDIAKPRMQQAYTESLCLVCGLAVARGVVFLDMGVLGQRPLPTSVTRKDLGRNVAADQPIADGGCLHERCAKMTVAHCRTIRKKFQAGDIVLVPYSQTPDIALDLQPQVP